MHHSRLCNIRIDCQDDDLATATAFWSQALGKWVAYPDQDGDGRQESVGLWWSSREFGCVRWYSHDARRSARA